MKDVSNRKIDPFAPWVLRGLELRNRFIKAATYEGHCPGGRPDREGLAAFHEAFARGGAGLCTVSYGSVEPGGRTFDNQMCLQDDILDDLRYVTGKIHAHGAKAAIQLAHCGGMSKWSGWIGRRARGPSAAFNSLGAFVGTPLTRAFKVRELRQLAEDYKSAAVRAVDAGFDALVLSGGFTSRNAMYLFRGPTFVEELIKAQRRKIDKLVYSMARPSLRSLPFEELYFLKHARKVRAEVGLPLICVGGVQSLASVHRALEDVYDAVQLGRALIHDPALVNHYREGTKTESGCTVCNLCVAEMDRDGVKCVLNDDLPARVRPAWR